MKNIYKLLLASLGITMVLAACQKEPSLLDYQPATGVSVTLNNVVFTPTARDSNNFPIKVSWTNGGFSTDFANVKYITQVDYRGNNFANPISRTTFGTLRDSMQNKVINAFVLERGTLPAAFAELELRVISSFANNNERRISAAVPFRFRAYKIPPRVALPASNRLYIVGSATENGWGNPVPTPTQELARLSETSWGGVFFLNGGAQYLILPVNGSWDRKYSVANSNVPGLNMGGDFGADLDGNFPGPETDGLYKIIFDFQLGKFTVEPFEQQHGLPTQLVVVGGASPIGWNNNANNPQRFTRLNSAEFQLNSIALAADDGYLILPEPGNWGKKYGVPNRNLESARISGPIVPEGQDFKSPLEAGNYRINVNFVTETYRLTKL